MILLKILTSHNCQTVQMNSKLRELRYMRINLIVYAFWQIKLSVTNDPRQTNINCVLEISVRDYRKFTRIIKLAY